jgi:hypothetical protein
MIFETMKEHRKNIATSPLFFAFNLAVDNPNTPRMNELGFCDGTRL